MNRLDKHDRLWRMSFEASKNGTCNRGRCGCVIARDGLVVSTGYNGSVDEEPHCDVIGCKLVRIIPYNDRGYELLNEHEDHCVRTIHAERNAILNAAILGHIISYCDWYITAIPCWECSKMIARTKPHGLFICVDNVPLHDDNDKIIRWWKNRKNHFDKSIEILRIKDRKDLTKTGIIE